MPFSYSANAKIIRLKRTSAIYNGKIGTLNTLSNACALTEIEPVITCNGGICNKLTLHRYLPVLFTKLLPKHPPRPVYLTRNSAL